MEEGGVGQRGCWVAGEVEDARMEGWIADKDPFMDDGP